MMIYDKSDYDLSSVGDIALHNMVITAAKAIIAEHWNREQTIAKVMQNLPAQLQNKARITAYIDDMLHEEQNKTEKRAKEATNDRTE